MRPDMPTTREHHRNPVAPPSAAAVRWARAAFAWMVVSFVWHAWMGIDYEAAMGPDADGPVWVFLAYDGLITVMSAVGGFCVVATVRPWGQNIPQWTVRLPLLCGSALLVVRGVPGMVENISMILGITPDGLFAGTGPATLSTADHVRTLVINGYFFLGAVVLLPVAVFHGRQLRARQLRDRQHRDRQHRDRR
ncbi:Protein of unknown function (DUF3995) [Streptoalloteichus tenebrarius]|uniref:DUF3995 domain-containing protein n=1 Tax=Streptoalloteichus tenebrarius (strain ATCC 17920 / DSM 40477 / JCM 4838 / CBS 697.72 / NBRC 16177 / NCIMB 11028 / NRRL B-12390 / A12253. 1 / ISP 5477) TaxID=1933 RepID=A0ABT1HRZ2_STRSD|nr:DUF3995 domain-containing protein [Streptoalloteichus tenebrarius]MCP2258284.1 Protein of unknown function (DUF3995) [Streptoalloteichus tenebrarius]BFF04483.1 hypothetical protein GCM10020241_61580 [Streptoalloteichus tenebrarius]